MSYVYVLHCFVFDISIIYYVCVRANRRVKPMHRYLKRSRAVGHPYDDPRYYNYCIYIQYVKLIEKSEYPSFW